MIFVGNGSLLRHALVTANESSIKVDLVCVGNDEGLVQFCRRMSYPVLVTVNVNEDLFDEIGKSTDGVVVSVNNSSIIGDELLTTNLSFYNIHNGLVQKYRGIAEVCVLAAVCKSEIEYGSTLHRLLPGEKVDAGPVLDQRSFKIGGDENFEKVFSKSIGNFKNQIEITLPRLVSLSEIDGKYLHGSALYSYKDVRTLIENASEDRRELACDLGKYSGLLPKLSSKLLNN
jgi:folate-dependent phosphoribosylglycinamide formyltransferase PurN